MWGVRSLYNFGRVGPHADASSSSSAAAAGPAHTQDAGRRKVKRGDEEDAMEGGLKGRISAGAELYFSAKEKSAGGMFSYHRHWTCTV